MQSFERTCLVELSWLMGETCAGTEMGKGKPCLMLATSIPSRYCPMSGSSNLASRWRRLTQCVPVPRMRPNQSSRPHMSDLQRLVADLPGPGRFSSPLQPGRDKKVHEIQKICDTMTSQNISSPSSSVYGPILPQLLNRPDTQKEDLCTLKPTTQSVFTTNTGQGGQP